MWGCSFLVLKGNLEFSQLKDEDSKGKTWKGRHATGRTLMNTYEHHPWDKKMSFTPLSLVVKPQTDDRFAVPSVPYLLMQWLNQNQLVSGHSVPEEISLSCPKHRNFKRLWLHMGASENNVPLNHLNPLNLQFSPRKTCHFRAYELHQLYWNIPKNSTIAWHFGYAWINYPPLNEQRPWKQPTFSGN